MGAGQIGGLLVPGLWEGHEEVETGPQEPTKYTLSMNKDIPKTCHFIFFTECMILKIKITLFFNFSIIFE